LALFLDIEKLSELVSMGTLSAFTIVNLSVLILRHREFREAEEGRRRHLDALGEGEAREGERAWAIVGTSAFGYHVLLFTGSIFGASLLFRMEHPLISIIFLVTALVPFTLVHVYFWIETRLREQDNVLPIQQPNKHGELVEERGEKGEGLVRLETEEGGEVEPLPGGRAILSDSEDVDGEGEGRTDNNDDPTDQSLHKPHHNHHHSYSHHHRHIHYVVHEKKEYFKTPLCPCTPLLGMGVNIFLICQTAWITWLFFLFWLALAVIVYAIYGYRNSKERGSPTIESDPNLGSRGGVMELDPSELPSSSFSYDYSMDYDSSSEIENT
jgi:amino acid transporter